MQIETYRGTVDELVEFVNRVWTQSYDGKMTFPSWNPQYFEWQLRLDNHSSRENLIAAYDGDVLAGVLLGADFPFRSPIGMHKGSQWSWLSIHADYRNQGIAKALHEERVARQTQAQSRLIVGFRYVGSRHSQAERPRGASTDSKFNRKVGFWARVLDPARFASWHWNSVEGVLARMASRFIQIPRSAIADPAVRDFQSGDLSRCLDLARASLAKAVVAIAWDANSLLHQLNGSEISQTLVLEEAGQLTGYVNFHVLPFHARTIEKVAICDLMILNGASMRGRVRLLNAALARMQQQGAVLALKCRSGEMPVWPLLRTHFVPQLADSFLVLQPVGEQFDIPSSGAFHVLWR